MNVVSTIDDVHAHVRASTKRRVFVPTMGALHRGHAELMRIARESARIDGEVAVSIFVNPLQFEPGSDFEKYPRPLERDENICREAGVDLLFRPTVEEMYGSGGSVYVDETDLARRLEGRSRPGHFRGVCTVVAKLFNILAPDAAVFGEKDFQQLAVIRRMVHDLDFPIEIIGAPIVRGPDGLACSSRNAYLHGDERKQATVLSKALNGAKAAANGNVSVKDLIGCARDVISEAPLARIDYVEIVDVDTLQPVEVVRPKTQMLLAVFFGRTRLIDNMRLR